MTTHASKSPTTLVCEVAREYADAAHAELRVSGRTDADLIKAEFTLKLVRALEELRVNRKRLSDHHITLALGVFSARFDLSTKTAA